MKEDKSKKKKKPRVMDLYWKIEKDLNTGLSDALDSLEIAIKKKQLSDEKVKI